MTITATTTKNDYTYLVRVGIVVSPSYPCDKRILSLLEDLDRNEHLVVVRSDEEGRDSFVMGEAAKLSLPIKEWPLPSHYRCDWTEFEPFHPSGTKRRNKEMVDFVDILHVFIYGRDVREKEFLYVCNDLGKQIDIHLYHPDDDLECLIK